MRSLLNSVCVCYGSWVFIYEVFFCCFCFGSLSLVAALGGGGGAQPQDETSRPPPFRI